MLNRLCCGRVAVIGDLIQSPYFCDTSPFWDVLLVEAHSQHSTSTVKPLAFSAIAVGASGLSELALL